MTLASASVVGRRDGSSEPSQRLAVEAGAAELSRRHGAASRWQGGAGKLLAQSPRIKGAQSCSVKPATSLQSIRSHRNRVLLERVSNNQRISSPASTTRTSFHSISPQTTSEGHIRKPFLTSTLQVAPVPRASKSSKQQQQQVELKIKAARLSSTTSSSSSSLTTIALVGGKEKLLVANLKKSLVGGEPALPVSASVANARLRQADLYARRHQYRMSSGSTSGAITPGATSRSRHLHARGSSSQSIEAGGRGASATTTSPANKANYQLKAGSERSASSGLLVGGKLARFIIRSIKPTQASSQPRVTSRRSSGGSCSGSSSTSSSSADVSIVAREAEQPDEEEEQQQLNVFPAPQEEMRAKLSAQAKAGAPNAVARRQAQPVASSSSCVRYQNKTTKTSGSSPRSNNIITEVVGVIPTTTCPVNNNNGTNSVLCQPDEPTGSEQMEQSSRSEPSSPTTLVERKRLKHDSSPLSKTITMMISEGNNQLAQTKPPPIKASSQRDSVGASPLALHQSNNIDKEKSANEAVDLKLNNNDQTTKIKQTFDLLSTTKTPKCNMLLPDQLDNHNETPNENNNQINPDEHHQNTCCATTTATQTTGSKLASNSSSRKSMDYQELRKSRSSLTSSRTSLSDEHMILGSPLVSPPASEADLVSEEPTSLLLAPSSLSTSQEADDDDIQFDQRKKQKKAQIEPMVIREEPIDQFYELESRPFARGKFAQVKRCLCKTTNKCFAAKCIKKRRRLAGNQDVVLMEIEALQLAQTDRIVKLYEVFETRTDIILILEMANGGDLQRVLDEEESLEECFVKKTVRQILEALIELHDSDIAHLDLKPQNLLLTEAYPNGNIKLCDFGFSSRISKDFEKREIFGTPDYVAPEILRYDPITLSTDMWSLGVLVYVLLSGFSPFGGDTKQETFCNITQAKLDFPGEIFDNSISKAAIDFIKKLIILEPKERLTSRQARAHIWLTEEEEAAL